MSGPKWKMKVICAGYAKPDGTVVACGKFLHWIETDYDPQGMVSHGSCDRCSAAAIKIWEDSQKGKGKK